MSLRNMTVQYVGDTLYLPTFERDVKHIVVRNEDVKDWEHFEPKRTCKPYGKWERVSQTQEVRHIYCDCGEYLGMDRRDSLPFEIECKADMPNYCPNCGAKVVGE